MSIEAALCSTLAEIRHRASFRRSPLEIFKILNLGPPSDWDLSVSFDDKGHRLLFKLAPEVDPLVIVRATQVALFEYDVIQIGFGGKIYRADWRAQADKLPPMGLIRFRGHVPKGGYVSFPVKRTVRKETGRPLNASAET